MRRCWTLLPHGDMKAILSIFLAASLLLAADDGQTLKTTDGEVYTNATITELRPNGAVVNSDTGIVTVAYAKLPKELQTRYGYDVDELGKYFKQGVDGDYTYGEGVIAFAGATLKLEKGQFTHSTFNDVPSANRPPLHGRFTIVGNWLVFHHPELARSSRVFAVINGRLALLSAYDFKQWKESGKLGRGDILYQQKLK